MITPEQINSMRRTLLGRTIEMKVGDTKIIGKWDDIQIDTKTGKISGVYVRGKLYQLSEIRDIKEDELKKKFNDVLSDYSSIFQI